MVKILGEQGYTVEREPVAPERFNVLAVAGEPRVVLCTHLDTVPPALEVDEDEEFLYGRGACDTKGIIAAMIEAGARLRRDGITSFGFLFVVGEETDGMGARIANKRSWSSRFVIVGEPTENRLVRAQKGTLTADLTVEGRSAHSGYPEAGSSAVHGLIEVLQDCLSADWGSDPDLGRGTLNVGVLEGGERANIIARRARASVMLRTVMPRAAAEERLRSLVGGRATIGIVSGTDPQALHVIDGFPTTVVSFGSDVPYLGRLGRALLAGPGSILDAHTLREKISKNAILDGVDLYCRLVRRLLE